MKNKKGFLLGSETLKIIIAVICIVFLIFLLFQLYYSATGQEKTRQAQESMEKILLEIERIDNGGEPLGQGIHVPNPSGWYVFSFTEDKKPNSCAGAKCICICDNVLFDFFDRQIKECDKKGACNVVSNLKKFDEMEIGKGGINLLVEEINNEIEIRK
jgi:hypothetical protein